MSDNSVFVSIEQVCVQRDAGPVLSDLSVSWRERRVGLIGGNGSGKSTLLRLLNGLVVASAGRLLVAGVDPAQEPKQARRLVGMAFQNPEHQLLLPTVAEDVAFGLSALKTPAAERAARCEAILSRLDLSHLRQRPCHALSGGEKQLVALAGVLVMEPKLVACDEPTTLLDLRNRNRVRDVLLSLSQPLVVATHDLELLAAFDRVLVLSDGRLVADDAPGPAIARYRALIGA